MRQEVKHASDVDALSQKLGPKARAGPVFREPIVHSAEELSDMDFPIPEMLIEGMNPLRGASLLVGAPKSGKTLLAVQKAVAVASGKALFGFYRVLKPGPAMIVEQDDKGGEASIKQILERGGVLGKLPLFTVQDLEFRFGDAELFEWLEKQAISKGLRLVVLDSYTALRGSRRPGGDIVKAEQGELAQLDALAKRVGCSIEIIHHSSKGSAALDWTGQAAGTYAMAAATESQTNISRFPEFDGAAPERLVRVRGRHSEDIETVLRFQVETLDFAYVLDGGACTSYPLLLQINDAFQSASFTPKQLTHAMGFSIATAHRHLVRLYRAGALQKTGYGEYSLTTKGLRLADG